VDGLLLVEVGILPAGLSAELAQFLTIALDLPCAVHPERLDPSCAFDPARNQYDARELLRRLDAHDAAPPPAEQATLAVADVDLCSPVFTFVFGEARHAGDAAIVSLHRLRPEWYGLPADPQLLAARLRRVALHEVGHLAGLLHCREPDCVMRFSGSAEELDLLQEEFCPACDRLLSESGSVGAHRTPASVRQATDATEARG
jgi:archaemetzincin